MKTCLVQSCVAAVFLVPDCDEWYLILSLFLFKHKKAKLDGRVGSSGVTNAGQTAWVKVTEFHWFIFYFCACESWVRPLHNTSEIPPLAISELSVWLFPHREESITTAFQKHHTQDTHPSKYQIPVASQRGGVQSYFNQAHWLMLSICRHSNERSAGVTSLEVVGAAVGSGSGWAIQYHMRSPTGEFHACLRYWELASHDKEKEHCGSSPCAGATSAFRVNIIWKPLCMQLVKSTQRVPQLLRSVEQLVSVSLCCRSKPKAHSMC